MWVAIKSQLVRRGAGYQRVNPGEPVPEAEFWPNRAAYVSQGVIKWVEDVPTEKKPAFIGEKLVGRAVPIPSPAPVIPAEPATEDVHEDTREPLTWDSRPKRKTTKRK